MTNLTSPISLTSVEGRRFLREVEQRCGEEIARCYQCGKCTAGCPLTFAMDIDPARIMRLLQLGQREAVLRSRTIWLCASCETCTSRCPQEVDLARVMDALRGMAVEAGYIAAEKEVATFIRTLLESVKRRGRVFEAELIARYNIRSRHLFQDADKAPMLLRKGKLSLRPPKVKGLEEVRRIFENAQKLEGKKGGVL